jgi:hypothetical protein
MAIHYTTSVDGDILTVRATGFDESLAEVQDYGKGIVFAAIEAGVTRVLCDESELDYRLGTLDTFRAAEFISAHAPSIAKVAIVCNPHQFADARFFEDVAVNRGLALRVCTDLAAASHWLSQTAGSARESADR